jgi:hypothetical protein
VEVERLEQPSIRKGPRALAAGQHDRLYPLIEFGGDREDTFFGLSGGVLRALA